MKPRESIVRLKMFQVQERQRQLAQLTMMMEEFGRMARELEAQIAQEEQKSGISDMTHFTSPPLAWAARRRHENLCHSLHELEHQKQAMQLDLDTAICELSHTQSRLGQECHSPIIKQGSNYTRQRRAMTG